MAYTPLNGVDGSKKVKGLKRHIVVDKNGFDKVLEATCVNFLWVFPGTSFFYGRFGFFVWSCVHGIHKKTFHEGV